MKLFVFAVVLVGLIGASKEQNFFATRPLVIFQFPSFPFPSTSVLNQTQYTPLFYANGLPAGYDLGSNNNNNNQVNISIPILNCVNYKLSFYCKF